MHVDSQLVEQVVTAVLERLREGGSGTRAIRARQDSVPQTAAESTPAALVLDVPVLTAEILETRLQGKALPQGRELQVGVKTVLTPSARDFLRQSGIAWTRRSASQQAGARPGAVWRGIAVSATAALQRLCEDPADSLRLAKCEWLGCTDVAVDQAVAALARAEVEGVVLFTAQTARAVCRANRNQAVRAASVGHREDVDAAREQMGANLLVISPAGKSVFELRQLVRAATSGPPPRAPGDWKS